MIKVGGTALEDISILSKCARAVVELVNDGHSAAVVHGGGAALTRMLRRIGKESAFVNGLRRTDAETRDAALMVLAGIINKKLVAAISACGKPAMGICGGDGMSFRARKKQTNGSDLGYVGEIAAVECRWLEAIWAQGGIPVIASIALGADHEYYNVNADEMAAACAIACQANALIFLTDVAGVKNAEGTVIRWLDLKQIPTLVKEAVVAGGMLPKLEACGHALQHGVRRVRILPAAEAHILPEFYFSKLDSGTEVVTHG